MLGLLALTMLNGDVRAALWWAVVPAVLSALLVLLVREPLRNVPPVVKAPRERLIQRSPLPKRFWRVAGVLVIIALVNFPDALLLLRVVD